jgi:3-deoxy-manno-octulosonate cytidylyltransferase (CMP-KDO synthetase)
MAATEFRVVIPARYASIRFPGKPLALLAGRSMIRHVYDRAVASGAMEVIVATDDERIASECRSFGAPVAMTRTEHKSGTDRVAEVALARGWRAAEIVVNVQGDSPLVPPRSIGQVAGLLESHPGAAIATLCSRIGAAEDYRSPSISKVVMDGAGRALYFSRAPIPCAAHGGPSLPEAWRHLGLYAYRVGQLERLSREPECYLETVEKLEQLRALWLGMEIRVAVAEQFHGPDVDNPEDVATVERHLSVAAGTPARERR